MTHPLASDVAVDARLARSLIESQFPALKPVRLEPFGSGWDNTAYRVNDSILFRFPRRDLAVPLIDTECRVLPALAPRLPVAIPRPEWLGRPGSGYPWAFAGYRMLAGRIPEFASDDRLRVRLARPLAGFLRSLHSIPPEMSWRLPLDTIGRLHAHRLIGEIRKSLGTDHRACLEIAEGSARLRPADRLVLVHGDLHYRNFLVDDDLRLSGIIDWGDVHQGDPAVDLSVAWSFLPPDGRAEFRETYGPIDDGTWSLARLRAPYYGVVLIDHGREVGDPASVREGQAILRLVASE